jgi:hypothetical protein
MRAEREAARRGNASVVISTVLSLLVVVAAVAIVAYLVLRTPSSPVDSAQRLEPVGTALPAPTDPPTLPTAIPTAVAEVKAEPTALGFSGEQPAVAGLPTVAAAEEATGPTPTPRVIAQPTAVPPTAVLPAPTLPPAVAVTSVPVVALQPVEVAAPAPSSTPAQPARAVTQPTAAASSSDDPFNIFDDQNGSRIVPAVDDPVQRVRDMQDEQRNNGPAAGATDSQDKKRRNDPVIIPTIEIPAVVMPTIAAGNAGRSNDPNVVAMPDVDAMIGEITARATDPNRNPNVNNPGRQVIESSNDNGNNNRNMPTPVKRKSSKDKSKGAKTPTPTSQVRPNIPVMPNIGNNSQQGRDNHPGVCTDPTAPGFPFNC